MLNYLLTLPPYGFVWFLLSTEAEAPGWSSATPGPLAEQYTFVMPSGMQDIVAGTQRKVLLHELLPSYIQQRRWFQNKDEGVGGVEINAFDALPGAGANTIFAELLLHIGERIERYTLPMTVAWEDEPPHPFEAPLAIARVRRGRRIGLLTDAFATPVLPRAMVRGVRTSAEVDLASGGKIICRPTSAMATAVLDEDAEIHWPGAEQSNSTLLIGNQAVMKLFRHLIQGVHPEAEMSRALTERGFAGAPALLGDIVRIGADGAEYTLAVLQVFVENQGDGWDWSLRQLERIVEEGATPFGRGEDTVFAPYAAFARTLGRRVGEMHALLAQASSDAAFEPELATKEDVESWYHHLQGEFLGALKSLQAQSNLPEADAVLVAELSGNCKPLLKRLHALAQAGVGTLCTRIHGDLHLGQVLVAGADVQIIDFEGEPRKTLEQRRAKACPLRDVAGLLRSFDYAAGQIARNRTTGAPESEARAITLLQRFRYEARNALLAGYAEGGGKALPPLNSGLLDFFVIDKAAYEVAYEVANRPDWLVVPLRGLVQQMRYILEGAP
jgi:maltose alpha-D-glucosyltransferase/alpha-amylase